MSQPVDNTVPTPTTWCLAHRRLADQPSSVGLICPDCKERWQRDPPRGNCRGFWESQPHSRDADGQPRPVFTLAWDDFQIRSLHPSKGLEGIEAEVRELLTPDP